MTCNNWLGGYESKGTKGNFLETNWGWLSYEAIESCETMLHVYCVQIADDT